MLTKQILTKMDKWFVKKILKIFKKEVGSLDILSYIYAKFKNWKCLYFNPGMILPFIPEQGTDDGHLSRSDK